MKNSFSVSCAHYSFSFLEPIQGSYFSQFEAGQVARLIFFYSKIDLNQYYYIFSL